MERDSQTIVPTAIKMIAGALMAGIFVALLLPVLRHRVTPTARDTQDSWARTHPTTRLSPNRTNKRYRAFVPAEQAIKRLKSRSNSQETVTSVSTGWRSSHSSELPWFRRRNPRMGTSTATSDADVYLYDSDGSAESWKLNNIVRGPGAPSTPSAISLDTPQPSMVARPLPQHSGLDDDNDDHGKAHGLTGRLARWLKASPLRKPEIDIPQGDFSTAIAYVGASLAATMGGRAMKQVPME
ncbi:hypothetical protein LTR28_002819, partial [Elasticomyces elasticus]